MKQFLLFFIFIFASKTLWATHNRAGEISIKQTGPLTIEATITTYTKASSTSADRDSLTLEWGDGTQTVVVRQNGSKSSSGVPSGEVLSNDIKKNIYVGIHTYPGFAPFYVISTTDQNRNASVKNVNPPNSDMIAFSISTTFTFLNQQFQGLNNTPKLLQPPIDFGCVGEIFTHNPSAFDIDGDSLHYYFTVPRQSPGKAVPGYTFPDKIGGTALNNQLSINNRTGDIVWNAPRETGEYNIAIMIVEFRNGIPIDSMIRDMQIFIQDKCNNKPPTLKIPKDICVVAGQLLEFDVIANDSDAGQTIKLTATGGPLSVTKSPAIFKVPAIYKAPIVTGKFSWKTSCEHISNQYYTVVFRVNDDVKIQNVSGKQDTTGLATLQTLRIKVVAPAPEKLEAAAVQGNVNLTWENPYLCDNVSEDYFFGFSVWRKEGGISLVRDTCAPGLTGKGYTKVAFKLKQTANGKYFYSDKNVERGKTYCYRVQAEFTKLTPAKNPYNLVESLWSDEVCLQLNRDVPLLVNVDVEKTDATQGEMNVRWSKPNAKDLDTLLNKPPYRYELLRTEGLTGTFVPVVSFTQNSFSAANDTFYKDLTTNTLQKQYTYKINFYVDKQTQPLGVAATASSVFLTIAPTDKANVLTWNEKTPWLNFAYVIYRKNLVTSIFDSIATTTLKTYRDEGLENGTNYCYYIKSKGTYGIKGIKSPLENRSQELCASPLDNVPPCPTTLIINNICTQKDINPADTINKLSWRNPQSLCKEGLDTRKYKIYYALPQSNNTFKIIETIDNQQDTTYEHKPEVGLAGCYYVTAIDSVGNESKASNTVCVDNCPLYELPNTFTPNGNGQNDSFSPFPTYRFIAKIEMQIFNRWGDKVFETINPAIDWDGKNLSGIDLAEGTYYYTCKVYEQKEEGIVPEEGVRSGFIELIRGK